MNYRERMREYLKEPDEYSLQYGKWGALNKEQRDLIKRLLREMDNADEVIKHQFFEIERLNNVISEANKILSNILAIKDREHKGRYRPIKNTSSQDVYKAIIMLNELLKTPYRENYGLLQGDDKE